jgi:large subunit ribosomal protein L21
MYAIFRAGGRQYRAEIGGELNLERLPYEVGATVDFKEVLLLGDGPQTAIGKPLVKGAMVKATVVEQFRGKKIIVWKYRPRKRYRRKQGHRQHYTRLRIDDIVPPKAGAAEATVKAKEQPAKEKAAPKQEAAPDRPSGRKSLAGLGVNERIASLLSEGGITTAGAFIKALEEGGDKAVLDIKGFGQKGLEEVKAILAENGYELPE